MLLIGAAPLTIHDLRAVARDGAPCRLSAPAAARIAAAHATILALLGTQTPIYGVTTGLGAAVDTTLAADPARQRTIPLARAAGVGPRLPRDTVRAAILARLSRLAEGHAGISLPMAETLVALLNQGITPVVPAIGSIGEADLIPLAHVAAILSGTGHADYQGTDLPAPQALARAGITVPPFGPKDGLALVSSNAASVGTAALLAADTAQTLDVALAAAALSLEAFRGSLLPFDPRATSLRPTPDQADTAAALLSLLSGSDLLHPAAARRLQDPLSFRLIASIHAAAAAALTQTTILVELELNSSDDNPAITASQALPTANFDATALALALESLGQSLLRVATASAGRVLRLMSPATTDLPRFLAPPGQNGFATVQKTLAALLAIIQHDAAPMPAIILPVADSIEDYASMAGPIADKTARVLTNFRYVIAIELMVAAQACDLRPAIQLGTGTAALHARIRAEIPSLTQDRPTGPDMERISTLIFDGSLQPRHRKRSAAIQSGTDHPEP